MPDQLPHPRPERQYKPLEARIFVFADDGCFNPPNHRPIRGCPRWRFEVDSAGTGNYDMFVQFAAGE